MPYKDGAVAEWLGRALQKLARRFDSGSCLQFTCFSLYKQLDRQLELEEIFVKLVRRF